MSDQRCCSGGQRPLLSGDRGVEQQLVDPPHHPHRQHDLLLQRGPQCLYQVGNINFRKASEKWKTKNTVYSIDCVSGLPCLAKEMKDLKHILFDFKIHVWSRRGCGKIPICMGPSSISYSLWFTASNERIYQIGLL